MAAERLVPDGIEGMLDHAFEGQEVGHLAMGLDDGHVNEAGLNLHECIRETLQAVAGHRARRAHRSTELVGDEFVENPEPFVIVFGTREKRIDVGAGIDAGVRVGAGCRFKHEFLPTRFRRRRTERRHADPDNSYAHTFRFPPATDAGIPESLKRLSHAAGPGKDLKPGTGDVAPEGSSCPSITSTWRRRAMTRNRIESSRSSTRPSPTTSRRVARCKSWRNGNGVRNRSSNWSSRKASWSRPGTSSPSEIGCASTSRSSSSARRSGG